MAGSLLQTALRRSLDHIKHVAPARMAGAEDTVTRVYRQAERDFGMLAPPVALHSPAPGPLAGAWMMLRESLLADGQVSRGAKEVVAAAVSLGNACPYCVAVHSATLSGLLGAPIAAAVSSGDIDSIADPDVRALAQWACRSGRRPHGRSENAPFSTRQAPEIIAVAITFHYLNRMVDIFLNDSPLPPAIPAMARGSVLRVLGRFMSATARHPHRPGASLELLPAAPLPADLGWAAGSPHLAEAFARASTAIEAAGRQHVPASVQAALRSRLAGWDGRGLGVSRSWVQEEVLALPAGHQSSGRLVLLAALAPFQVDQSVIDAFRREQPGDEALIASTSWASMAAARQVGSWLRVS
jgi:alkylhydroperoxidase family enzyme